uniref:Uncharacterized protein n=1 Tax=Anguilla anguilla TaxID=7936 RepID=A0A0E9UFS7_ANGAN
MLFETSRVSQNICCCSWQQMQVQRYFSG